MAIQVASLSVLYTFTGPLKDLIQPFNLAFRKDIQSGDENSSVECFELYSQPASSPDRGQGPPELASVTLGRVRSGLIPKSADRRQKRKVKATDRCEGEVGEGR